MVLKLNRIRFPNLNMLTEYSFRNCVLMPTQCKIRNVPLITQVYVLAICAVVVIFTDLVAITTCVSTPNKYLVGGCVGAPIEPFEQTQMRAYAIEKGARTKAKSRTVFSCCVYITQLYS